MKKVFAVFLLTFSALSFAQESKVIKPGVIYPELQGYYIPISGKDDIALEINDVAFNIGSYDWTFYSYTKTPIQSKTQPNKALYTFLGTESAYDNDEGKTKCSNNKVLHSGKCLNVLSISMLDDGNYVITVNKSKVIMKKL